jgi:hypothetical protein
MQFMANADASNGVCGGAVGWSTALQAGRSRVQFLMVSLEFFIYIILPAALWPWGWLRLQKKCFLAADLTTFMCRLSWNLGATTSWSPQGLSRPVTGIAPPLGASKE